jgi:hypothetical protein
MLGLAPAKCQGVKQTRSYLVGGLSSGPFVGEDENKIVKEGAGLRNGVFSERGRFKPGALNRQFAIPAFEKGFRLYALSPSFVS